MSIPEQTTNSPPIHWRKIHALGLPEGSIRALLAVAIFTAIWILLIKHPEQEVPDYLRDLLFIIMGHYFASRRRATTVVKAAEPGPFFLPRGSIRLILFGGFVAVGIVLYREGRFRDPVHNPGVVTLMLVAGFLLGVAVAKIGDWWHERGHRVPRWIEDFRALVAILAAVGLLFLIWNRYDPFLVMDIPKALEKPGLRIGQFGPEHLLSAVVGFYFGSRS